MKSPSQNSPEPSMKKQRSASPSQAIPRSAPVERPRSMISRRFSSNSGFGSWSGNSPSGTKYISSSSSGSFSKVGPALRAPLRLHRRRIDEGERVGAVFLPDVDLLQRAAARRLAEARFDLRLHFSNPGVAG